jgi:hypothetical protein
MAGEFSMEFLKYQFCIESDQRALVEEFKKKQAERAAAGLGGGISLARI